ncbi:hypothetical protein LCGC14_1370950 [marine sediment metagenome]|uniref:FCP1 homology domain-containing protein n=1 Tax=marine sediment metagenome TaxID=412755 RepID=A0A0F9MKN9_9ZZZZ
MRIIELQEQQGPQDYKLFVDLDGVLVDWHRTLRELTGIENLNDLPKKEFWRAVGIAAKKGRKLWYESEKTHDADQLWDYVKGYDPTILTAGATSIKSSYQEKRDWVRDNLGSEWKVIVVDGGREKYKYAAPNHILIDDRSVSVDPWVDAGGIGILHTSAKNTIENLKELGL